MSFGMQFSCSHVLMLIYYCTEVQIMSYSLNMRLVYQVSKTQDGRVQVTHVTQHGKRSPSEEKGNRL